MSNFLTVTKTTTLAINSRGGIVNWWDCNEKHRAKKWLDEQRAKYPDVPDGHTLHGLHLEEREDPACSLCEDRERIIATLRAERDELRANIARLRGVVEMFEARGRSRGEGTPALEINPYEEWDDFSGRKSD